MNIARNNILVITLAMGLLFSCHKSNEQTKIFDACQGKIDWQFQFFKAPNNLFQINFPDGWAIETDFNGEYFTAFAIDTTQLDSINTIGINVKNTRYKIEELFLSELNAMKNEFFIVGTGKNLFFDDDRWVVNKEIIHGKEVANLLVYLITDNNVYIIHVTTSITDRFNYLNDLCKFLPILKSFTIIPRTKITLT